MLPLKDILVPWSSQMGHCVLLMIEAANKQNIEIKKHPEVENIFRLIYYYALY